MTGNRHEHADAFHKQKQWKPQTQGTSAENLTNGQPYLVFKARTLLECEVVGDQKRDEILTNSANLT
jgi:hypothetical protein